LFGKKTAKFQLTDLRTEKTRTAGGRVQPKSVKRLTSDGKKKTTRDRVGRNRKISIKKKKSSEGFVGFSTPVSNRALFPGKRWGTKLTGKQEKKANSVKFFEEKRGHHTCSTFQVGSPY